MSYTGEYQYRFRAIPIKYKPVDTYYTNSIGNLNITQEPEFEYDLFPYRVGERIGQIYLEEVIPIEFEEVDELSETIRGTCGFGSTGNS